MAGDISIQKFVHIGHGVIRTKEEALIVDKMKKLEDERFRINIQRHKICDSVQEHRGGKSHDSKAMASLRLKREAIYRELEKLNQKLHKLRAKNGKSLEYVRRGQKKDK